MTNKIEMGSIQLDKKIFSTVMCWL